MKPIILLVACCTTIISCSKKNETPVTGSPTPETPKNFDYKIKGIGSATVQQDTSIIIDLLTTTTAGKAENVKLSVTGLPEKIKYTFSKADSIPDFSSKLTLTIAYPQPNGYTFKVIGTSTSGLVKEHPIDLKVNATVDCVPKIAGTYNRNGQDCSGYFSSGDVTIKKDAIAGKILIENLVSNHTVTAHLNCTDGSLTFDDFTLGIFKASGFGTFDNGSATMVLNCKPITPGTGVAFGCTATLKKK